jgi:hypothetical protein
MTEHLRLIARQLAQLTWMRESDQVCRPASAVRKGYRLRLSRRHNFSRAALERCLKAAPAVSTEAALVPRTGGRRRPRYSASLIASSCPRAWTLIEPHAPQPTSPAALGKSLWRNRQLILQMTQREVLGRYKGSFTGYADGCAGDGFYSPRRLPQGECEVWGRAILSPRCRTRPSERTQQQQHVPSQKFRQRVGYQCQNHGEQYRSFCAYGPISPQFTEFHRHEFRA